MKAYKRFLYLLLAVVWVLVSWTGAVWYAERKVDTLLVHETDMLESNTLALYQSLDERLRYLSVLPALSGKLPSITRAVERYSPESAMRQAGSDPKAYWTSRPDLAELDKQLLQLTKELEINAAFVLNAEGYCIASSNSTSTESFVGTLYKEHHYFKADIAHENAYH